MSSNLLCLETIVFSATLAELLNLKSIIIEFNKQQTHDSFVFIYFFFFIYVISHLASSINMYMYLVIPWVLVVIVDEFTIYD